MSEAKEIPLVVVDRATEPLIAITVPVSESEINALIAFIQPRGKALKAGRDPIALAMLRMIMAFTTPAGQCSVCGCTGERACDGGCEWVDERANLCDRCLR